MPLKKIPGQNVKHLDMSNALQLRFDKQGQVKDSKVSWQVIGMLLMPFPMKQSKLKLGKNY